MSEQAPGATLLTGAQALVQLCLLQSRLDKLRGYDTAGYVSGYRGSPLAGLDLQFQRQAHALQASGIVFQPGLNEDLAVTACWGTQQSSLFQERKTQGVFALWYGKGPGVDRSGDALKHANHAGTSPFGGVLMAVGDDHNCHSSSLPHQSDFALKSAGIPVLQPSGVEDILQLGLYGWSLSRNSGLWVALKLTTEVVESTALVRLDEVLERALSQEPSLRPNSLGIRWPDPPQAMESRLYRERMPSVVRQLNERPVNYKAFNVTKPDRLIVASGTAYLHVREIFRQAGIGGPEAQAAGLDVVHVQALWPLTQEDVLAWARGAKALLVLEDKGPLLESQLRELLYGLPDGQQPSIEGKKGQHAATSLHPWVLPPEAGLSQEHVLQALRAFLPELTEALPSTRATAAQGLDAAALRKPHYCAGCPHGKSTALPEGSKGLLGVGCHVMATWIHPEGHLSPCHMGAEGALWLGARHFVEDSHIFANLGDGTYMHSGSLAIRAAVAENATITFKLLYNSAVAMTGGQTVEGAPGLVDMVRQVLAERVSQVVVLTGRAQQLHRQGLPRQVRVRPLGDLQFEQKRLTSVSGVTVLFYDEVCATVNRRKNKSRAPAKTKRIAIHPELCEDCGGCVEQSKCVALPRVATAEGFVRQIDPHACNNEGSCTKAECPSFLVIEETPQSAFGAPPLSTPLPAPQVTEPAADLIFCGVGGQGTLTLSNAVAQAAAYQGLPVKTADFAGMAQKGGSVRVHVRLGAQPHEPAEVSRADLLLAIDPVGAASALTLRALSNQRTKAVINLRPTATGSDVMTGADSVLSALQWLRQRTREDRIELPASVDAQGLQGDPVLAGLRMLGVAFQSGWLPLSLDSLRWSLGRMPQSEWNLNAFEEGRRFAALARSNKAAGIGAPQEPVVAPITMTPRPIVRRLDEYLQEQAGFLTQYQDAAWSHLYRDTVHRVLAWELGAAPEANAKCPVSWAVARNLQRLMSTKDELEVARILSAPLPSQLFSGKQASQVRVHTLLAPAWVPGLRKSADHGLDKLSLNLQLLKPALLCLAGMRRWRQSWFNPFRYTQENRSSQTLLRLYQADIEALLRMPPPQCDTSLANQVHWLSWPELTRGYGQIRLRNAKKAVLERELRHPGMTYRPPIRSCG